MANSRNMLRASLFAFLGLCFFNASAFRANLYDRGAEIHYTKISLKPGESFPKEIKMNGEVYPLFHTREEACKYVRDMGLKRDITVVYVATSEDKETETVSVGK